MAKKYTIEIPDDLDEAINKWADSTGSDKGEIIGLALTLAKQIRDDAPAESKGKTQITVSYPKTGRNRTYDVKL